MKKLLLLFTLLLWLPFAHANQAEFYRARVAYAIGDYATALPIYKKLAEQGHAKSQFNLATMYATGTGIPINYTEALKWYSKLAEQGHAKSQFNLAIMYSNGKGVSQNNDEALKWYHKAAEQGYTDAQLNLALKYAVGEGLSRNYIKAYMWASVATANGSKKAKNVIQFLEKEMDSASITKAQELATQCFQSNYQNCDEE